jgi:hypothetical protein
MVRQLCQTADDFLESNRFALARHSVLHHAFRRSERRHWLTLLFRTKATGVDRAFRLDVFRAVNESARIAVMRRALATPNAKAAKHWPPDGWQPDALDAAVARVADLSWQVNYNRACAKSIEAGTRAATAAGPGEASKQEALEEGMALLEGLFLRPNAEQLQRAWALKDPDLAALRSDVELRSRFNQFLVRLSSNETDPDVVRSYAAAQRNARLLRDHFTAVDEAAFGGNVRELWVEGSVSQSAWTAARRDEPWLADEVQAKLQEIVRLECAEAIAALRLWTSPPAYGANLTAALSVARNGSTSAAVLLLPDHAATPAHSDDVAVVKLPPGLELPCRGVLISCEAPPVVRSIVQDLDMHVRPGHDKMLDFVVHERASFRLDPRARVVRLVVDLHPNAVAIEG